MSKIIMDYPGLHTVVSGGQTGSDQAGLFVARQFGLKTGGHIPKGFRTQAGSMPSLGVDYGLIEHSSADYQPRTKLNAKMGDATVRLASNFNSPGEILTLKYCRELKKPVFDVHLLNGGHQSFANVLAEFIIEHHVGILNVAGNSDKANLNGIHFNEACHVLVLTFNLLKSKNKIITSDFC